MKFEHQPFGKRLKSMLKVDFRRMFTQPLLYIMIGIALVIPILVLVMTTMMDGSVSVDPTTGVETVIEGFDNAWHAIAKLSTEPSVGMDMVTMCNINLLYFAVAVFVCIFVSDDFRSGYVKNLFAVRAKKADYVISKTLAGFVCGALMILAWVVGTVLGGSIVGLPFDLGAAGVSGLVMCLLGKIFLMLLFVALALLLAVAAKQKLWMSITFSLMSGMLFFMMIPMLTPLDSGAVNVIGCLLGGVLLSIGFGTGSNMILKKSSLV